MSLESRRQALERAGLVHPRPGAVTAELFGSASSFFLAADKVQVKYEMLRAVAVDGVTVMAAAAGHGYSPRRVLPGPRGVRGARDGWPG